MEFIGVISNHFNSWNSNWVFLIYPKFVKLDFNTFRDDNGVGQLDGANHKNLSHPLLSGRTKIG